MHASAKMSTKAMYLKDFLNQTSKKFDKWEQETKEKPRATATDLEAAYKQEVSKRLESAIEDSVETRAMLQEFVEKGRNLLHKDRYG
jgi:hypothetical protein